MRCRHCGGKNTRVTCLRHLENTTKRYCRCLDCGQRYRTLEHYEKLKPGPPPGRPKRIGIARGSANGASVLTEDDVRRLRTLSASGIPHKHLACKYGLHIATISRIVNRKLWSHVS
jgi:hypothetical protein